MTPTKPYLIRAFYEWIVDNDCTPYIVVNAELDYVDVPAEYVESGQIVLNIAMDAVQELELDNDAVTFKARFSGKTRDLYIPSYAVMAIYAKENGRGMVFAEEEDYFEEEGGEFPEPPSPPPSSPGPKSGNKGKKGKGGKPHLTVVK